MVPGASSQGNNSTIEKYCYNNDSASCGTYGGLYQWDEAMQYSTAEGSRGICPPGWHMPTRSELEGLRTAVGGDGNSLKAVGQGTGSGAGTNTSGFSALLAGGRYGNGAFNNLTFNANLWSSTQYGATGAIYLHLYYADAAAGLYNDGKTSGFSVRCLKD